MSKARLIDADALCNYANNLKDKQIDANDIMRFPTVDAVPVVYCKDCRFGTPVKDGGGNNAISCGWTIPKEWRLNPDWYCASGERRRHGERREE